MAKRHRHARGRGFFLVHGRHAENSVGFLSGDASGRLTWFGGAADGCGLYRVEGPGCAIVSSAMALALFALRSQCRHALAFYLWHYPLGARAGLHHLLYFSAFGDGFGRAAFKRARQSGALGRYRARSFRRAHCDAPRKQCRFALAILGRAGNFRISDLLRFNRDNSATIGPQRI